MSSLEAGPAVPVGPTEDAPACSISPLPHPQGVFQLVSSLHHSDPWQGWKAVAVMWLMNRKMHNNFHKCWCQTWWYPGTSNRLIQSATRASAGIVASKYLTGTLSNHLLERSIMIKWYLYPSAALGKGPTRSVSRWLNCFSGTRMACVAPPRWLPVHLAALALLAFCAPTFTSAVHLCHSKWRLANHRVDLMFGWASPFTAAIGEASARGKCLSLSPMASFAPPPLARRPWVQ